MADQNESLTDFEEGARGALEWLGRSEDGAELPQIVGEMPKIGDMEGRVPHCDRPGRAPGIRPRRKLLRKQRLGPLRCHRRQRRRHSMSTPSEGGCVSMNAPRVSSGLPGPTLPRGGSRLECNGWAGANEW